MTTLVLHPMSYFLSSDRNADNYLYLGMVKHRFNLENKLTEYLSMKQKNILDRNLPIVVIDLLILEIRTELETYNSLLR